MNIIEAPSRAKSTPAIPSGTSSVLGLTLRSVHLSCGEISYAEEGAGPVLVLLHGAPLTSLGFARVIRRLRAHYRVIAPDLPGFGYSRASPHFSATLASYADMVVEFCSGLRLDHLVLYLNDSSGCFGLRAAAQIAPQVVGIVVADTVRVPLEGAAWLVKLVLKHVVGSRFVRFLNRRLNLLAWLVVTVAPWLEPFSREERAVMTQQFDTAQKRDRILDVLESMGRDEVFMRSTARLARERLSAKPVLLLYGQFDPMRFASLAAFRALFRRSIIEIIPLEEHFPILSSGERVAKVVHEWMQTLSRPAP
jgi:haloalkane dehalogenase